MMLALRGSHGHEPRGSKIEEFKGTKFLNKRKHTSRGSKLMNLIDCIGYVHIHVLACICISFNLISMLVAHMLVLELE
jgi:hypothetical protein